MKKLMVAAVLLLCPSIALAGGPYLPTRGVHATSMGGAFVAGAEGPNALWYNPANMDETSLGVEVGVVSMALAFTPSEGEQAGLRVENDGRPLPNPTFGFVFKVNEMF